MMYPCLSSVLESRLALRINHSYEEQARAYRTSWDDETRHSVGEDGILILRNGKFWGVEIN